MAASTTAAYAKKVLANPEPSTHGPSLQMQECSNIPGLGAIADTGHVSSLAVVSRVGRSPDADSRRHVWGRGDGRDLRRVGRSAICARNCARGARPIRRMRKIDCETRGNLVGVAGFEPATPSSRTRADAGRSLNIQRFSSRSRTFVRIRFARSCGRICGRTSERALTAVRVGGPLDRVTTMGDAVFCY